MTSTDVVQKFQYDVGELEEREFSLPYMAEGPNPVVMELQRFIPWITDQKVRLQVSRFCATLESNIRNLHAPVSPLYIDADDGDVYLEWVFDRFRFGFYFFHDESESTWGMTVENPDGSISEYGGKFVGRFDAVVKYVIEYAERHA